MLAAAHFPKSTAHCDVGRTWQGMFKSSSSYLAMACPPERKMLRIRIRSCEQAMVFQIAELRRDDSPLSIAAVVIHR